MIKKSLVLLAMFYFLAYADGVVTLNKEAGKCMIINENRTKDCSKKGSYSLDAEDRVESSKVNMEDFSYNQTKSLLKPVFVLAIDTGYKVETSFWSYLSFAYNNFRNPNKNASQGGVNGYSNTRYKLPSETKILYGDRLEINIHKKDIKEIEECLLEDVKGNEIYKGYSCSKHKVTLDSNKLNKNKSYKLFIIYGKNKQKTINFSFVDNNDSQSIQKKNLDEQSTDFSDFKLYIYQINQKEKR